MSLQQMHPFLSPALPYSDQEQQAIAAFKAGGGPAEDVPLIVVVKRLEAKLRETVTYEHRVMEDNHRAPRDFWHVRACAPEHEGDTFAWTDWLQYGELGDYKAPLPEAVQEEAQEHVFQMYKAAIFAALGLEDFA